MADNAPDRTDSTRCTGDRGCPADVHVHGCYADFGHCDDPEHRSQRNAVIRDALNAPTPERQASMNTSTARPLGSCSYCGGVSHVGVVCPRVKAIEYHGDGTVRRVEFHPPTNGRPS